MQILIVAVVFAIAFLGMALSLHFSKYKKDGASCCGGGHCDASGKHHHHDGSCYNTKIDFVETFDEKKLK
ncbi:MAG: hypothetical protein CO129_10670 [Ignavibacteriales bacterium CG_4_9_14_3_um_filter_34_10]|nr:MAG: hypothetical protein CO129_10670 [Ignavibacteriales bacterium CG_4_9_14_3_um_filter_34_10]